MTTLMLSSVKTHFIIGITFTFCLLYFSCIQGISADDVPDIRCNPNPCGNGNCTSNGDLYNCTCNEGYISNNVTCVVQYCEDEDVCASYDDGTYCVDSDDGYHCVCNETTSIANGSYTPHHEECIALSINCFESGNNGGCDQFCEDTVLGLSCSCEEDYTWNDTKNECVTEKFSCDPECDAKKFQYCVNDACECLTGYINSSDNQCIPAENCETVHATYCGNGATCVNSTYLPGYHCNCSEGFVFIANGTCLDINECLEVPNVCEQNETCTNTEGNYTCTCQSGFVKFNNTCIEDAFPCESQSDFRLNCQITGNACRTRPPGQPECYCPVPYKPLEDGSCQYPKTGSQIYLYELDFVEVSVTGSFDDTPYTYMRQLEDMFYTLINETLSSNKVLNIEALSFEENNNNGMARAVVQVLLDQQDDDLQANIMSECENYKYVKDTCVIELVDLLVQGNITVKTVTDICSGKEEFLCGDVDMTTCTSTSHEYNCSCSDGYRQYDYVENPTRPACKDINECLEGSYDCGNIFYTHTHCVNTIGSYTCECNLCTIRNSNGTCNDICNVNPCQNNGYCASVQVDNNTCGYGCTCSDDYIGPDCSQKNDALRVSRNDTAIVGGVLGGLLGVFIIAFIVVMCKLLKRSGYLSFSQVKKGVV